MHNVKRRLDHVLLCCHIDRKIRVNAVVGEVKQREDVFIYLFFSEKTVRLCPRKDGGSLSGAEE